jgi:hypothetical protein
MDNAIMHRRRLVVFALAVALALAVVVMLPRATSAAPPEPVVDSPEVIEGECDFPVLLEVSGKEKVIEFDGNTLITAPGLRATLTNLDEPTNQVTVGITGTVRITELANGDVVFVFRGRNLLSGPDVDFILTIGRFTGSMTAAGEFSPITGKGKVIDICALLE